MPIHGEPLAGFILYKSETRTQSFEMRERTPEGRGRIFENGRRKLSRCREPNSKQVFLHEACYCYVRSFEVKYSG